MTIDEKTKRYIKEVFYYDVDDASNDIIRLLEGVINVAQLSQTIAKCKARDEKEYGDTIYKKEE